MYLLKAQQCVLHYSGSTQSVTDARPLIKTLMRAQPLTYAALLASSQSARHTWEQAALLQIEKQNNHELLRVCLFLAVSRATSY
jgi:hypothetical protein